MMTTRSHICCLLFAAIFIVACKKGVDVIPDPPSTIVGKWQYVMIAGGPGAILSTASSNTYLQFNADSTYKQYSSNTVTYSGSFHIQTIISVVDGTKKPAVSFSNTNGFNGDSWCKQNTITIKDDTLRLTSNGYPPHGGPVIQVFKLSN